MVLDSSQLEFYRENGFVAVPHFFDSREVAAMQAELERLKAEGHIRNVSTAGDGKTPTNERQNLQIIPIHSRSGLFRALPFKQKVVHAISELIGEPAILHLDQIFLKPGKHGAGTAWHQDNYYFQISDPMKGVGMWTAVHDATVANGTMHVIPRMFAAQHEHSRDQNSDHHFRCFPDESLAVPIEMKAGGVLFFCYGTPHCTLGNSTDRERAGAAFHFLRADYAQPELIEPTRKERPFINGPNATWGEREYGQSLNGAWERDVEKVQQKETKKTK